MHRRTVLACGSSLLVAGPAPASDGTIRVALRLAEGVIEIDVFAARAPLSAAAFLAVVDARGYDGGSFFRVVRPDNDHGTPPISGVQGRARVSAPAIPHETTARTGLHHLDRTVSLPRDAPGTATGAEFFICIGDQPSLDYGGRRNPDGQGFAAFGRVVSGMGAVRRVWSLKAAGASPDSYTAGQMLRPPVRILDARRMA